MAWGADFVRLTGGSRTVSIEFALLTDNRDTRQTQLREITRWARSATSGRLELPNRRGVYLEAVCTALPEPSLRQWWESKLRIVFTTFDNPYWTSVGLKSAACGTAFMVLGDAPPLMQIVRTLTEKAVTPQTYSNGVESMTFSEIYAGNMTIDLNRETASVGGVPIMYAYTYDSHWIPAKTGLQTITGTGTVLWRERWE